MKWSFLIGVILFFVGAFIKFKILIAAGIIFIIISFFGRMPRKGVKEKIQQKISLRQKNKCGNCGAELLPEDNFCPECGKKFLP